MIRRLPKPLVHGAWTEMWWGEDPGLSELFGHAPDAQESVALATDLRGPDGWTEALRPAPGEPVDPDSLVVVAGQQPVLGGGPLLVAHKAATAVAFARALQPLVQRPVVPVFLVATQDHDTTEVDHLDLIHPLHNHLRRYRCPLEPRSEMFARCGWDKPLFDAFKETMKGIYAVQERVIDECGVSEPAAEHVARLLERAFSGTGLRLVEAHRLRGASTAILDRALDQPRELADILRAGEDRLRSCGFPRSFDPADPRPLVLESEGGRRKRVGADDGTARQRLADNPADFSPHAALRPIIQAATLPVVAQVAGPSEILYLGQARGLHEFFGVTAPQLVPRLEATRVRADELETLDTNLRTPATSSSIDDPLAQLLDSVDVFRSAVTSLDEGIAGRVDRFAARVSRDARVLAESPAWRGRGGRADPRLRPRGRMQDSVLGWLPEAFGAGALPTWAEDIIALSQPFDPPVHVLHASPKETL